MEGEGTGCDQWSLSIDARVVTKRGEGERQREREREKERERKRESVCVCLCVLATKKRERGGGKAHFIQLAYVDLFHALVSGDFTQDATIATPDDKHLSSPSPSDR